MPKADMIEMEGIVTETLKGGFFKVECDNGHEILAKLGGKIRMYNIRINLGDQVLVEVSPYDLSKGRITYRVR